MRSLWAALAVCLSACSEPKPASRGLRISLPDGWAASPAAAGVLRVGPKGRGVVTLEKRAAALPTLEALRAAVVAEGVTVTRSEATPARTTLRYAKPDASEGLLTVRLLEPGVLLLCASTAEAEAEELDAAQVLCGNVRLEAAP